METTHGTALITGASSGIGRELAGLLAARKHPLVLVGRDEGRLTQVADGLRREHGVEVRVVAIDLSRAGAGRELFERTRQEGVEVSILINNAGVGLYGEHTELALERVDEMLQLNVVTLCDLCQLYGAEMKARGSGRILNVASTAAYQPTPFFAAYGASKAFVLNFSEALAMELADHGVSVTCLSPGPTDTAFFGEIDSKSAKPSHFAKSQRVDARTVAEIGLKAMFSGQLSTIVGAANALRAWSLRFASRKMVAQVSKGMMRAAHGQG